MSINPGSDIVLDVMKAADPTRAEQTTARLDALGAMSPPDPSEFTRVLMESPTGVPSSLYSGRQVLAQGAAGATTKAGKAATAFEAEIIDSFVKEMLPKNASDVYGQGEAGDIWRSMLSDQISNQIAKNGELGIARKLFATHALHSHGKADLSVSNPRQPTADAVQASENPISISASDGVVDGAVLFKGKTPT
jgi:peptidoglycan hydrolase FlgJ